MIKNKLYKLSSSFKKRKSSKVELLLSEMEFCDYLKSRYDFSSKKVSSLEILLFSSNKKGRRGVL